MRDCDTQVVLGMLEFHPSRSPCHPSGLALAIQVLLALITARLAKYLSRWYQYVESISFTPAENNR